MFLKRTMIIIVAEEKKKSATWWRRERAGARNNDNRGFLYQASPACDQRGVMTHRDVGTAA